MDGSLTLDLVCMDKLAHHGNPGPWASSRVDGFSTLHVRLLLAAQLKCHAWWTKQRIISYT